MENKKQTKVLFFELRSFSIDLKFYFPKVQNERFYRCERGRGVCYY